MGIMKLRRRQLLHLLRACNRPCAATGRTGSRCHRWHRNCGGLSRRRHLVAGISSLAAPGPVDIATTGHWAGQEFGLTGGLGTNFNHAKLGVSTSTNERYAIFGDMNQQGTLSGPNCASSQNGRGGTFYVVSNPELTTSLTDLISGASAPAK